jgi:hypothetical protein
VLGSLITLPLRFGIRSAEAALHASQAVAERAIALVGQVVAPTAKTPGETPRPREEERSAPQGPVDPRSQAEPAAETVGLENREPELREPDETEPATPVPTPPEPDHVSEDAVVVEEVSEPGAEDGAGAQIHVAEPWEGYREMKAPEVVDRLHGMGSAELAAVELYELSHRRRQTVLDAAARELRRAQSPRQ